MSFAFYDSSSLEKAQKAALTPLSLDKSNGSALFAAEHQAKPYHCSLEYGCDCKDFLINKGGQSECKHLIRLNHELGFFTLPAVVHDQAFARAIQAHTTLRYFVKEHNIREVISFLSILSRYRTKKLPESPELLTALEIAPFLFDTISTARTKKYVLKKDERKYVDELFKEFSSRTGKYLSKSIETLPEHIICYLASDTNSEPSTTTVTPSTHVASTTDSEINARPKSDYPTSVTRTDLIPLLERMHIQIDDKRSSGGCLWIENTRDTEAFLSMLTVDGSRLKRTVSSGHFKWQFSWYLK